MEQIPLTCLRICLLRLFLRRMVEGIETISIFLTSFERVDRNFKTLRLQLIVQLIMKKIKIFTRLFLSSGNLYRCTMYHDVNKNLGNHKMIQRESNGERPGIVAITGRRFGMQENFNIIDNRCMTRLKGDEARCAHEWQFFNTFFSFFFFFLSFRDTCIEGGIRGDEFGSPILSEIDRMKKKRRGEEKRIITTWEDNSRNFISRSSTVFSYEIDGNRSYSIRIFILSSKFIVMHASRSEKMRKQEMCMHNVETLLSCFYISPYRESPPRERVFNQLLRHICP